jgi:hypothetical protein
MCLAVVPGSLCWSWGNRSTSLLKTLKCLPFNRFLNLVLGRNKCDYYPASTDLQSDWVLHRTTNIKRARRSYGSAWITAVHSSKKLCCHATWSSNSRAHKRALSSWWRIAIGVLLEINRSSLCHGFFAGRIRSFRVRVAFAASCLITYRSAHAMFSSVKTLQTRRKSCPMDQPFQDLWHGCI